MARLLRMPEVAANAAEAVLSEWAVPENSTFAARDAIATVETEKAVVEVPAETDGVILKTLVHAGALVSVGSPIAVLGDPGEQVEDLDALLVELGVTPDTALSLTPAAEEVSTAENGSTSRRPPVAAPASATQPGAAAPAGGNGTRVFSSPLARRLAKAAGLSMAELRGTGPGGRVVRRDVQRATDARTSDDTLELPPPTATSSAARVRDPFVDTPHTPMRRVIATRLTQSTQEAPHFFVRGTARVDKLQRLRGRLNDAGTVKVSVNDLVVTAASRAHMLVPAMNVIWMPDAVRSFGSVDISIAIATDRGLVTPVLRGVDQMTVSAVATTCTELISRARSGRLQQDELEGGTLTVTNLGGYGTEDFAAIINPPQSAILAVGAARPAPVVTKGKLKVGTVMSVTLSVDHRPVDGAVAAQWMRAFVSLLEEPVRILL
jgi:pyruvate dehydrogenase E2 component (dihydrolipoamide acetyltransferase)